MARKLIAPCKAPIGLLLLCMAWGAPRAEAQARAASITVSAQVLAVAPSAEALAAGLRLVGARPATAVRAGTRTPLATVSWRAPAASVAGWRADRPSQVLTIEFLRN
jgi:hypothetical protein